MHPLMAEGPPLLNDRLLAFSLTGLLLLVAFIYLLKLVEAWLLHRSVRAAIQRDSSVATDLLGWLEANEARIARQRGDDRAGLLLIAIGAALVGFTLVVDDPRWLRYGVGSALFPIFTGIVLVARHIWIRRSAGRAGADES